MDCHLDGLPRRLEHCSLVHGAAGLLVVEGDLGTAVGSTGP